MHDILIRPFASTLTHNTALAHRVDSRGILCDDFSLSSGYTAGMSTFPAVDLSAGFVHNGQIVYALQYDLECEPPSSRCLIVWLTPSGDATAPWIEPAYLGKRIVTTKLGEHVRFRGKLERVTRVSVYRSLPLPEATP